MKEESLAHVEIVWPDGSMMRAGSWPELETKIRIGQWRSFATMAEFRRELASRAKAWSGSTVPVTGTSEDFLQGLAAAGLYLVVCNKPDKPGLNKEEK